MNLTDMPMPTYNNQKMQGNFSIYIVCRDRPSNGTSPKYHFLITYNASCVSFNISTIGMPSGHFERSILGRERALETVIVFNEHV
jgi:hypothetical protein